MSRNPAAAAVRIACRLLPLAIAGCGSIEEYGSPSAVFEATFGAPPGPAIRGLQGEGRSYDVTVCYLRFRASRQTLDALTAGGGFRPISGDEFRRATAGAALSGPRPGWWDPPASAPTAFFTSGRFHPNHARGRALSCYADVGQVVHVYWDGID